MGDRGDLTTRRWRRVRLAVLDRDGWVCQLRGPGCAVLADTVDHVVPVVAGGTHDLGNLRAACRSCNSAAGARLASSSSRRVRGRRASW